MLRALRVGSPPGWEDVPEEVQAELATLDRLDDDSLYRVARERWSPEGVARYDELLERNAEGRLSKEERGDLAELRDAHDRLALRRAHAAALLRWRGPQAFPGKSQAFPYKAPGV